MTSNERAIIRVIKDFINQDDLNGLQEYYTDIQTSEIKINWQYIYQTSYIHACLKQRTGIVEWLTKLFDDFDPISKIGMRQMFSYGRHLQSRHNPYLKNEDRRMNEGHTG